MAKPAPPLALKPAPEPSPKFQGRDLTKIPAGELAGAARQFYDNTKYREASQLLHYAIKDGADGGYDLACDYAQDGKTDAAFYWLQKTALEEGVDATWAAEDGDLESLRKDKRWMRIASFLSACNAYWAKSDHHTTILVVPKGYKPGTPIGVLVGMHGRGMVQRDLSVRKATNNLPMSFPAGSNTSAARRGRKTDRSELMRVYRVPKTTRDSDAMGKRHLAFYTGLSNLTERSQTHT